MVSFELTEPFFDKKKTAEYELSVLLRTDSLSYCVMDKAKQVLSVVKTDLPELENANFSDRLEKVILRDITLQQSFRKINMAVFTHFSTLIPERLYDEAEKASYLEKLFPLPEAILIRDELLSKFSARNVYCISEDTTRVLNSYFSGSQIKHSATSWLNACLACAEAKLEQRIFLNVQQESLQIAFFEEQNLVFYNCFSYSSSKDFIYFVMLIFDQFNLKPDTIPVYISGEVMEDSEIYHLIYRYIRHLRIIQTPEWIKLSEKWETRPQHWFYELFCLGLAS